tara:strand:+ start:284 stop:553 length:270 start_codon:yes stop_codon:yes gene_type:complete
MPRSCIDVGTDVDTETSLVGTRFDDLVKVVELATFSPHAAFLCIGLDHQVGWIRKIKAIKEHRSGDADLGAEQAVDFSVLLHIPPHRLQ